MIGMWLTAKGLLGLKNWIWIAIVVGVTLAVFAGIRIVDNALEDVIETSKETGATKQREGDLRETLHRTEKANEARDEVRRPGSRARYDQCLRTARTPENCQRFLPGSEASER